MSCDLENRIKRKENRQFCHSERSRGNQMRFLSRQNRRDEMTKRKIIKCQ